MKKNNGFTLIELLVVIAIIGILSSVVLASLNTARGKGSDATIKTQVAGIRPQAEIYYDTAGSYGATGLATTSNASCSGATVSLFSDSTIKNQVTAAISNSGAAASVFCGAYPSAGPATAWAISVPLKTSTAVSWCADSSGASKQITTPASAAAFRGCE